jgi:spore coat polysaccharide biosynthesis protein SpsF
MVDGQQSNRVLAVIQARYRSSRLPGKILFSLPFNQGKPILQHICDSVTKSTYVTDLVIATSVLKDNDCICEFAEQNGIEYFRGDEDDVLSRYLSIAEQKKPQIIIRLTADNPLQDIKFLDQAIQYHIQNKNQYTKTAGMPLGMNFEIVNADSLLQLKNRQLTDEDKEHVTKYIVDRHEFKKSIFECSGTSLSHLRCTIDYPSDYAMMSILIQFIDKDLEIKKQLDEIVKIKPWVFQINSDNVQVKFYESLKEEMNLAQKLFKQYGLTRMAEKLKREQ